MDRASGGVVETASFWTDALAHGGHTGARVERVWRGRRHENALLVVDGRRWLGRAPLAAARELAGTAPPPLASATEAAVYGRLPPGVANLGVLAPALLTHGLLDGRPYLVRQWIEDAETGAAEDVLADVCARLRNFEMQPLPRDFADQWHAGRRPGLNRRIEMVNGWAAQLEDVPTTKLLAIVRDPPDSIQLAFSHGGVAPDVLVRNAAGLWLVDFEQAAAKRAEFYDVAQCYFSLRVVPRFLSPGAFASLFHKALPRADRKRFHDVFRWHLAAMTIGGYLDSLLGVARIPRMNLDLLADDVVRGRLPG